MMKKIAFCLLVSLVAGFANVCASVNENGKPFVGNWDFWEGDLFYELELSLYDALPDGSYGRYADHYEDTSMEYRIINVLTIQGNEAEVIVDDYIGNQKASLKYDPVSGNISFKASNMEEPVVFKQKDKYGYVFLYGANKINVRSAPVSGTPLFKANRGQSFRFIDRKQGWFKVSLSANNEKVGYVSPQYAYYLKDNKIPDEAFTKSYSNDFTSIYFEKRDDQILMVKETMRILPDATILPALVESYLGHIEGNAIVFTLGGGFPDDSMDEIEPYVIYYMPESGVFIVEGVNYGEEKY